MSTTTTDPEQDQDQEDESQDRSQLMDLPGGGSVIVDPDDYAALVTQQAPTPRNHPDDPTDVANDYLDYKQFKQNQDRDVSDYKSFLRENPDLRRGPSAPSYQDQFRAALAAGGAVPRVGVPQADFQPQLSPGPSNTVNDGEMTVGPLQISHPAPAPSYEDRLRASLGGDKPPIAHALLNFGFDDPMLQEQYGEKHTGEADKPATEVEPQFDRNRKFVEQHFAKYRDKDGTLSPFYQAIFDNAVAKANAADHAEREAYTHGQVEKMSAARVKDNMPAPVMRANFAIPAEQADAAAGPGAAAGGAVQGVSSPQASYEDRVRAALQGQGSDDGVAHTTLAANIPVDDSGEPVTPQTGIMEVGKPEITSQTPEVGPIHVEHIPQGDAFAEQMANDAGERRGSTANDPRRSSGGSLPVRGISRAAELAEHPSEIPGVAREFANKNVDMAKQAARGVARGISQPSSIPSAFEQTNEQLENTGRNVASAVHDVAPYSGVGAAAGLVASGDEAPAGNKGDASNQVDYTGLNQDAGAPGAGPHPQVINVPAVNHDLVDPKLQGQYLADIHSQGAPIQAEANAMSRSARATADLYRRMGDVEKRNGNEEALQEKVRASKVDALMQQLQQQGEAISNAKVDPSHYWSDQDAGTAAMNTLALMVGGFISGFRGGPNQAMEMVNKAIDRDVDAQKFNITQKRNKLDTTKNELELMRLQFGDQRTAESAVRLSRINSLKAFVQAEASQVQDPVFQARAAGALAQLNTMADKENINMHHYVEAHQVVAGAGLGEAKPELYVPEVGGIALTPADAETTREELSGYDDLHTHLSQLQALRARRGQLSLDDRKQMTSLEKQVTLDMQRVNNYKRLSGTDEQVTQNILSDAQSIVAGTGTDANFRRLQADIQRQKVGRIRARGIVGGKSGYDPVTGQYKVYYTQQPVRLPNAQLPTTSGFTSSLGQ